MKKLKFKQILIIIFVIFLAVSFFKYIKKGYIVKYKIEKDNHTFNIVEIYTKNQKKETDNLYIEVRINDIKFNYQIYEKFSKRKVIKDIDYYSDDDYTCIYPTFIDDYSVDIKCYYKGFYYNYLNLKGQSDELDEFASSIKAYDEDKYIDDEEKYELYENIKIYYKNLNNKAISFTNLNGLYVLDNEHKDIHLFDDDIYARKLSGFSSKYYFTAKYDGQHEFKEFYIVDLKSKKIKTIKNNESISINSYVEGIVDGEVYIYDPDNEKQYKINLNKHKIEEVKNINKKVSYYSGYSWKYISKAKANSEYYFNDGINNEFEGYDIINKTGNSKSGFYYLFKKTDDYYRVYRTSVMNKNIIEYLFDVEDPTKVVYLNDTVYFIKDNSIYYYNQAYGIKRIVEYDELKFNENIKYHVFES